MRISFHLFLVFFLVFSDMDGILFAQESGTSRSGYGLTLEPMLGYDKKHFSGSRIESGQSTSMLFGARAGLYYTQFNAGIDWRAFTGKYKTDSGQRSYDYSRTSLGYFLGYTTPWYLRPYIVFVSSTTATITPNNTLREMKGDGVIIGLSVLVASVALTAEFSRLTWESIEEAGRVTTLTDVKSKGTTLIISWPFEIF